MKNVSILLNVILLGAVSVLFYLVLGSQESAEQTAEPKVVTLPASDSEALSVAYVNMDSLQLYYNYYKELMEEFQEEAEKAEASLKRKQTGFQESIALFERMAPTMNEQEFERNRADLENTRQRLLMDQQEIERGLMAREQELMLLMKEEVDSVLIMIKAENHLDFVFTYPLGSGLLYADDSYDITPLVTEKLNALRPQTNE